MTTQVDLREIEERGPEVDIICKQIAAGKRKKLNWVDLAASVTSWTLEDTTQGSSTLTLVVNDNDFDLLDSGFFDADANGKPDEIQVNFPQGSKYWWSLSQTGWTADGTLTLTFMERAAIFMTHHHGPVKASRSKKTRAEFLKYLADQVKAGGGIRFHSQELHKKQPLKKENKQEKQQRKGQGIADDANISIKGERATKKQIAILNQILDEGVNVGAGERPMIAMICAAIAESTVSDVVNSIGYGGVLQGDVSHRYRYFKATDRTEEAHYFMVGGKGYQGGGAIDYAKSNPHAGPGEIATTVEASGADPSFYGTYKSEAEDILQAYGGVTGGPGSRYKRYNFTIGTTSQPHEDFWTGSKRLADEVKWAYFLDGNDLYFDSELTLIKQQPVAVIRRGDAMVVDWDYTVDARQIATEFELTLICDPLQFRAGQVFVLEDFGVASSGSTAKPPLPGRWFIAESSRDGDAITTTFTLHQPQKPAPEPRPELTQTSQPDVSGLSPKGIIDAEVLPIGRSQGLKTAQGLPLTPENVTKANHSHGPTVGGGRSDHQGPPDEAWAVDMSNGWMTDQERRVAKALAKKFDIPWTGTGISSATHDGFRYQLIWGINLGASGGEHHNHVHFGIKRVKSSSSLGF
jgi:hypothetical protein